MTDLVSRPHSRTSPSSRRDAAAPGGGPGVWARLAAWARGEQDRSLAGAAALAALGSVVTGLAITGAVALVGWYLADAGAHGSTTDALGVGAQVWLLGHGARLDLGGVPLGIVPLGVTLLLLWLAHRLALRAGSTARSVEDDRTLVLAATVFAGVYLVLTVVVCVLVGGGAASASLPLAILGSLVLAGAAGTVGLARGTRRWELWRERVPGWVRAVGHGAAHSVATLLVVAAVLVIATLGVGFNDALALMAGLRLDGADQVALLAATLLLLPNAVLLGAAYLVGPGFAVGTGTVVSPTAVALGPVPAFPLLAALPGEGPTPGWLAFVVAVPALAALVGAARAQRAYHVTAYDSAALRGFGSGAAAGLLLTALVALAGGPVGTGRLAQVGAPVWEVAVVAVGAMATAGLVGGSAVAWRQRRQATHDGSTAKA